MSCLALLVQSCCGGEGHCRQKSLACVGSTLGVPATLRLPPFTECVLSPSTLLRLQAALQRVGPVLRALPRPKLLRFRLWVLHKDADWVGPAFCAFPGWSNSGSQELDEHTLPGCRVPYRLRGPSLSFCAGPVCLLSLLEADFCLRPSRQVSTIQNLRTALVRDWKPVCSLGGECCL